MTAILTCCFGGFGRLSVHDLFKRSGPHVNFVYSMRKSKCEKLPLSRAILSPLPEPSLKLGSWDKQVLPQDGHQNFYLLFPLKREAIPMIPR